MQAAYPHPAPPSPARLAGHGSAGVRADLAIGDRFPHLLFGICLLGDGALLLLLGGGGLYAALHR